MYLQVSGLSKLQLDNGRSQLKQQCKEECKSKLIIENLNMK